MPDYPDLPPVSQDPDVPLPDVAPNSDLVPYRIGRKPEGGDYQYTTGYAPRARPPIQPPQGMGIGGAGTPDLGPLIGEAFQRLPVEQALKAVEVASRYIGQRGYMKDLESGQNAAQAFAKWGPMLFRTAVGIPEAIDRSVPTPLSPQNIITNRRNAMLDAQRAQMAQDELAAAREKANQPKLHFGQGGEIIREKPGGEFEVARPSTASSEFQAGPVQGQPVLDPDTKEPIAGLIATPSAGGKGMTVRLTPKAQAELTPTAAAEYFKNAPDIDKMMGVSPKSPGSFTRRMATNMVDIASRKVENKPPPNPATPAPKALTKEIGQQFLKQAGGDKEKARKLARDAGYQF